VSTALLFGLARWLQEPKQVQPAGKWLRLGCSFRCDFSFDIVVGVAKLYDKTHRWGGYELRGSGRPRDDPRDFPSLR
jgi:hypothetical protein